MVKRRILSCVQEGKRHICLQVHHCLPTGCVPVEEISQGKWMCDNWEFFFYDGWTSDDDENIEPSEIVQTDTENADDNSTNPAEFQMAIEDKVTESPPNIFVCIEYHSM